MSETVRLVVVGQGRQGRRTAMVASRAPGVTLAATVDPDTGPHSEVPHFASLERIDVDFDAAIVATPTPTHASIVTRLVEAGIPTLVEKPIAATVEEARALVELAASQSAVLAVGHVERFNPAVRLVRAMLAAGRLGTPLAFSFRRVGLPPVDPGGTGVILDLGVHDIDVFSHLTGPATLRGAVRWPADGPTESAFLLLSAGEVSASIQVNWKTPVRVREFTITTDECYAEVNYTNQTVDIIKPTVVSDYQDFTEFQSHYGSASRVQMETRNSEPLLDQLTAFAEAVRGNGMGELADAAAGLTALQVAAAAAQTTNGPGGLR